MISMAPLDATASRTASCDRGVRPRVFDAGDRLGVAARVDLLGSPFVRRVGRCSSSTATRAAGAVFQQHASAAATMEVWLIDWRLLLSAASGILFRGALATSCAQPFAATALSPL